MTTRPLLAALTILVAGCASRSEDPTPPPVRSWAGVYNLIGSGFPEGDRAATLFISGPDTAYTAYIEGPPGHLAELRTGRDSLAFSWDLEDGSAPFQVRLGRSASDSVSGSWIQGTNGGLVRGSWRPAP
jgi:hypothetical protein